MFQRVVPEDATKASVTIYLILKKVTDFRIKKRYSTGKSVFPVERYDDEVDGVIIGFASQEGISSDIISIDDDTKAYPIMSFESKYPGSGYNKYGISVQQLPAINITESYLTTDRPYIPMKLSLNYLDGSKAKRMTTLNGNDGVTGTYLPSTRNPNTGDVATWEEIFSDSYFNTDDINLPYIVDIVDEPYIYSDNIQMAINEMRNVEAPHVSDEEKQWEDGLYASTNQWFDYDSLDDVTERLLNIFTAKSINGVEYMAIEIDTTGEQVDGSSLGGIINFGPIPVFLSGGTDGTLSEENYNEAVMNALKEYQDIYSPVLNVVYNVESTIVDTGFPIEVKEEFLKV